MHNPSALVFLASLALTLTTPRHSVDAIPYHDLHRRSPMDDSTPYRSSFSKLTKRTPAYGEDEEGLNRFVRLLRRQTTNLASNETLPIGTQQEADTVQSQADIGDDVPPPPEATTPQQ